MVVVALHERPAELSLTGLMMGETEIVGAVGYRPEEFDAVIAAMAEGFYDTAGWVQERPLEQAVEALHDLRDGIGSSKILLTV